jgi:hypothetical protein
VSLRGATDGLRGGDQILTTEGCAICLEQQPPGGARALLACGHGFCRGCIADYVGLLVDEGRVGDALRCPHCAATLEVGEVESLLRADGTAGQARVDRYAPPLRRSRCAPREARRMLQTTDIMQRATQRDRYAPAAPSLPLHSA